MPASLANITFDARDAAALAQFWSEVFELPVDDGASEAFASIGLGARTPAFLFLAVPEAPSAKNRVHLDLAATDRDTEVQRVLALGATRVADHAEYGTEWTVLADPEGNAFCVVGHSVPGPAPDAPVTPPRDAAASPGSASGGAPRSGRRRSRTQ